jgi:hypothetical protein
MNKKYICDHANTEHCKEVLKTWNCPHSIVHNLKQSEQNWKNKCNTICECNGPTYQKCIKVKCIEAKEE